MARQEREILERAVRAVSEQAANASAIVDEALDAGLDGSHPLTLQAKMLRLELLKVKADRDPPARSDCQRSIARRRLGRAACAWLIGRFIDPQATFVFVDDPADVPGDATAFDMRGADRSYHGEDCTFETMLKRYRLEDPVLWDIARIVHEADLADERFDAPEAPGLDVLLRGLSMVRGDEEVLAISGPLFDGLYEYRKRALVLGQEPS